MREHVQIKISIEEQSPIATEKEGISRRPCIYSRQPVKVNQEGSTLHVAYRPTVQSGSQLEPCEGRAAANLWAPPPTFGDRRAATSDILSARRRCDFGCVFFDD